MAFDFKKEYKEFYLPKRTPELVSVPPMTFVAVRGEGDPNVEGGAYKEAVGVLYAIAYTIKMSKMGDHRIDGYYDFVVPPLEGFWWQPGVEGVDFANKATFHWIAAIRLPDFVTPEEFAWAQTEAARKKGLDTTAAELLTIDEGLCAQIMHLGPLRRRAGHGGAARCLRRRAGARERYVGHGRGAPPPRDLPVGSAPHRAREAENGSAASRAAARLARMLCGIPCDREASV